MVRYLITSFSNTGQATLAGLLALGEKDVVVGARNVKEAEAKILKAGAAKVVELDVEKPDTLVAALKGVDRAILTVGMPWDTIKMVEHAKNFVAAAKANPSVKLIARVSAFGANPQAPGFGGHQGQADQALRESGIPFVIFEPTFFMSNQFGHIAEAKTGQVHGSAGDGKTAWIAVEDIGAFIAAILVFPERGVNKSYPLLGRVARSDAEFWTAIGQAAYGKPVQYISHPQEDHKKTLESFKLPANMIEAILFLNTIRRNGWAAQTDETYEKVVGRKQLTPEEWATKNAAAFK